MNRRQFLKGLAGIGVVMTGATSATGALSRVGPMRSKKRPCPHWAIEPRFEFAGLFCNGLANVVPESEGKFKFGFIDTTGQFRIPARFDYATPFCEDRAYVSMGGVRGYILKDGIVHPESPNLRRCVYVPQFMDDELALIMQTPEEQEGFPLGLSGEGKRGYVDKDLQIAIEPQFDYARPFSEGLAAVERADTWGYIDRTGNVVLDFQYDWANGFSEGFAHVIKGNRQMIINRAGDVVRSSRTEEYTSCDEGLIMVRGENGKWGYINTRGELTIPPRFDDACCFDGGMAVVEVDGKSGVIDRSGDFVMPPRAENIVGLTERRLLLFSIGKQTGAVKCPDGGFYPWGEKKGCMNLQGDTVIPPVFDFLFGFSDGLSKARMKDTWGYIDMAGAWVIPPAFRSLGNFSGGLAAAETGNKWGYIAKP